MKNDKFITIPVRQMTLDPQNKAQVRKLVQMADAKFRLSAKAWVDYSNERDTEKAAALERRHLRLAKEGEALLAPLGIVVDWPGLAPSFTVKGYAEHDTASAVVAALGHPRGWLKEEGGK